MKISNERKGAGLGDLIVLVIIVAALYWGAVTLFHWQKPTGKKAHIAKPMGYVEQQIAVGEHAKNEIKNVDEMLKKRYSST